MSKSIYKPWRYIFVVFIFTWIPWVTLIILNHSASSSIGTILIAIGGVAPTLATLVLLFSKHNKNFRSEFLSRLSFMNILRNKAIFYVFLPVVYVLLSVGISVVFLKGDISQLNLTATGVGIITFTIFTFFFGPLPEELGWRGYLLDSLWERMSLLKTSLLIGVIWGIWHVPLFFINGYPLQEMGKSGLFLFIYFIDLLPKSIIISYVYARNNRLILAAVLFHFVSNFVGTIIEIELATEAILLLIITIIATLLVIRFPQVFKSKLREFSEKNFNSKSSWNN